MDLASTPIVRENLKDVDISLLTLNKDKFGPFTFDAVHNQLEELKEIFVGLDDLSYESILPQDQINIVNTQRDQFINKLNWLRVYDPKGGGNINTDQQNYIQEIQNLYTRAFKDLVPSLTHLRLRASLSEPEEKELAQKQTELTEAKRIYEEMKTELEKDIAIIKEKKTQLESDSLAVATNYLSKEFDLQFKVHEKESTGERREYKRINKLIEKINKKIGTKVKFKIQKKYHKTGWLIRRRNYYYATLVVVVFNLFIFIAGIFGGKVHIYGTTTSLDLGKLVSDGSNYYGLKYSIFLVVFLLLLYMGISFATNNYNTQRNLATLNRHRRNVAQTLENFLIGSQFSKDQEIRNRLVEEAAKAMFTIQPTGYLTKKHNTTNTPAREVFNNVFNKDI